MSPIENIDQLKIRNNNAFGKITNAFGKKKLTNAMLENTWRELKSRIEKFHDNGGIHVEVHC